jgi:hypothetical protein
MAKLISDRFEIACPEHIPWLLRRLGEELGGLPDLAMAEKALRAAVDDPSVFIVKGEHAFVIAAVQPRSIFDATLRLGIPMLAGYPQEPWDGYALALLAVQWGKERGALDAVLWSIGREDLGPVARRLGAAEIAPVFHLELYR